jgi:hypothetical protein
MNLVGLVDNINNKQFYVPLILAVVLHAAFLMMPVEGEGEPETDAEETTEEATETETTAAAPAATPTPSPSPTSNTPANNNRTATPAAKTNQNANRTTPTPAARANQSATAATNRAAQTTNTAATTARTTPNTTSTTPTPTPTNTSIPDSVDSTDNQPPVDTEVTIPVTPSNGEEPIPAPQPAIALRTIEEVQKVLYRVTTPIEYPQRSWRNLYADFPLYERSWKGSLRLLQPEAEYRTFVFNTTQYIDYMVRYYRAEFEVQDSPYQMADEATISGDNYQVYQVSLKEGGAEPQYLHFARHNDRTVFLLIPQPLEREELIAATNFVRPEQVELDRILQELKADILTEAVTLEELDRATRYEDIERYTLHGKAGNRAQLQLALEAKLTGTIFLPTQAEKGIDPSVIVYEATSGVEYVTYLLLVPTTDGQTALVTYRAE